MKRPLLLVCIFLVCICALANRGKSPGEEVKDKIVGFLNSSGEDDFQLSETRILVVGTVAEKSNKNFLLKSISIPNEQSEVQEILNLPGRMTIEYPRGYEEEILCGRKVWLEGTFRSFSHATNPGEFDSLDYYDALEIYGALEDVWYVDGGHEYSKFREALCHLKSWCNSRLYRVFPKEQAGVLCAILLGEKNETDREIKDLYQRNGLMHILSISGMHITLLGMGLYNLLRRFGIHGWICSFCSVALLLTYGMMTGMSVSACRAIGMFAIHMLGKSIFRTYDLITALGIMGVILAIKNPAYLHYAGFLLSFTSVAGVGILFPLLAGGKSKRRWGMLSDSFLVGLSIMGTTLPIQLWFYYEVPYWSLILNMAVLPCMSILVFSAALAMCIPGAGILGTLAGVILWCFEKTCNLADYLQFRPFSPGRPEAIGVCLYYGILIGIVGLLYWLRDGGRRRRKIKKRLCIVLWGAVCFLEVFAIFCVFGVGRWRQNASVTFLDVGQGDCAVIQTAAGTAYVYDCGSMSKKSVGKKILIPFLKSRGIHCLEGVFLSHGDNDHESGLRELLQIAEEENIQIQYLFLPDRENGGIEFAGILDIYENQDWRHRPKVEYLSTGVQLEGAGVFMEVLSPPAGVTWENNASSLCLDVALGKGGNGLHILLTGDVDKEGEAYLLNRYREKEITEPDVLKLAHHGSRNSSSEEFLGEVQPLVSVISCGKNNSYGHPHEETLARLQAVGTAVFRTDQCGAITIFEKGGELRVECFVGL